MRYSMEKYSGVVIGNRSCTVTMIFPPGFFKCTGIRLLGSQKISGFQRRSSFCTKRKYPKTAATGQFGSAAIYQTSSLFLTNSILQILDHILLPFLSMSFAIAIANAVYAEHTLDGLLQFNKTIVTWSLGFLMSVFIGVISIQSIVSSAADGLTTKTTKYVVSNFVPIVGGAVSDAYVTVLGSLQVLKSTTGAIGIVVLLLIFLPILLRVVLYRLVLKLAVACADLFSVSQVSRFLKGAEQVLSMLFAILTCFAVLFLVTVALLLLISRPNL